MPRSRLWPGALALLALTSCAEGSTSFQVRYEPGFTPGPATISVLGVFHEGRMNRESWSQVGPPLSALLGQRSCEVAYSDELANDNPDLYTAFDESVRNEGIGEELLTRLAPYAEGSLILVVTLNGHVTVSRGIDDGSARGGGNVPQPGRGAQMRGGRGPGGPRGRGAELPEVEIAGTLFSVQSHHPVARLHMVYSGSSFDEAIGKFVGRIGELVPGSSCRGWRWNRDKAP